MCYFSASSESSPETNSGVSNTHRVDGWQIRMVNIWLYFGLVGLQGLSRRLIHVDELGMSSLKGDHFAKCSSDMLGQGTQSRASVMAQ